MVIKRLIGVIFVIFRIILWYVKVMFCFYLIDEKKGDLERFCVLSIVFIVELGLEF